MTGFRLLTLFAAMAASLPVYAQQFLPVSGIVNARDLGGYAVSGSMLIKDGMLLRAAHLADATDSDLQYLARIPVAKVVDFRQEEEMQGKDDRMIEGAAYVNLPIDASGNAAAEASEKEKKRFGGKKKFDVKKIIVMLAFNERAKKVAGNLYPNLIFDPQCQRNYAEFFRLVLDTESGAVLFHCTQGKDRTGIASALLLSALGADRETVVTDFDATNRIYADDVKKYSRRVKLFGGKDEEVAVVEAFIGANTRNFIKTLELVDREYGSMDAYLKGPIGLSEADILTLRERYLVEK